MKESNAFKPDFKILDGLRGIAATYVLINHARGNLLISGSDYAKAKPLDQWDLSEKLYYSVLQLTSLGREFVIVFFILSGFSIAYSLQKKKATLEFYRRRLIRLYPPYILALCWAALVFWIASRISPVLTDGQFSVMDSLRSTLLNLVYVPNGAFISQFWSLSHEVIFYLLIPFLILNRRIYYIGSVLLYVLGVFISWRTEAGPNIISKFFLDYNFYFAIGVYLFHNYKRAETPLRFRNKFLFYGISMVLFLFMAITKFKFGEYNKISLAIAILFSLILIVNFLDQHIHNKLLAFLGSMSYTIYITHLASIYLFKSILLKTGIANSINITVWYLWMIGVFFALAISLVCYYIAERPSKIALKEIRKTK